MSALSTSYSPSEECQLLDGPPGSPVVVIILAKNCRFSTMIIQINSKTGVRLIDQIIDLFQTQYQVRICIITHQHCWRWNPKYPADFETYTKIYPNFMLIPGSVFNAVMVNRNSSIRDGLQIWNGTWEGDTLKMGRGRFEGLLYDFKKVDDYSKWISAALNDPDFKRVHNAGTAETEESKSEIEVKSSSGGILSDRCII